MGRRKSIEEEEVESEVGEQMDLIDVSPENLAGIKPVAKKYRAAVKKRMAAGEVEQESKQELLAMVLAGVTEGKITRLPDGSIRFKCDGMTISVTPRDELVKVKEEGGDEE